MDFLDLQDQVFTYCAERAYASEVEKAKLEFIEISGPFDSEDGYLEEKMTHFREWFLFDYHLNDQKRVVDELTAETFHKLGLQESYSMVYKKSFKSIFMFQKVKNDQVYVKDLFSKEKIILEPSPFLLGVEKGAYVQARLFQTEDKVQFGQGVVTHPFEARKFIDKKIKLIKKSLKKTDDGEFLKEEFFKELLSMRYHLLKYKQLDVVQIYSDKSPVKELLANK